jgi:hypothetical protein
MRFLRQTAEDNLKKVEEKRMQNVQILLANEIPGRQAPPIQVAPLIS